MSESDHVERCAQIYLLRDDIAHNAVALLEHLLAELPCLERIIKRGVKSGRLRSTLHAELFGRGEGAGLVESNGLTIPAVLRSYHDTGDLLEEMLGETEYPSDDL